MPDWLQNSHADYVLAAYGVAAFLLLAMGVASWLGARRARQAWEKLEKTKQI